MNKYRNKITTVDNIRFHSQREAKRYQELKILQMANRIKKLELQPRFPLVVNDIKICTYVADFSYIAKDHVIIEDVKGVKTALYSIKKKLLKACYDIDVMET